MSSKIIDLSTHLSVSPMLIQALQLDIFEEAVMGGIDIVDATNPLMANLTASASQAAATIHRMDVLTRRMFPELSQTFEDLYPHMADRDLIGLFSMPARTNIVFGMGTIDLKRWAVVDPITQVKRLTIPRDTVWSVDGTDFYMHYPINVVVLDNGGYHCYFDETFDTPIGNIRNSNVLKHRILNIQGVELLTFEIPVEQIKVETEIHPVIESAGFKTTVGFQDKLHYVRAFMTDDDKHWEELSVTYSEQVYDPSKPTLSIIHSENSYSASIPEIYFSKGLIKSKVMLVTHTTKGETEMKLGDYTPGDWSFEYRDFNGLTNVYSEPLVNMETILLYSDSYLDGGTNGASFSQVKEWVLYGQYDKLAPVTDKELEVQLSKKGYGYNKQKDTVTEMTYVANRKLPSPNIGQDRTTSPIGVANRRIEFDTNRTDLPTTMINNGDRVTIRPTGLYQDIDGGTILHGDDTMARLLTLGANDLVDELNINSYFYTPYHYVFDSSTPIFEARAYYLTQPGYISRSYRDSNSAIGFIIATSDVKIELIDTNYRVTVLADIPNGIVSPYLQVSYLDNNVGRVHQTIQGTNLSDTVAEFVFDLNTTLDINAADKILIANMMNNSLVTMNCQISLEDAFDFIYLVETPAAVPSAFDNMVSLNAFTQTVSSVAHEEITLSFGTRMEGLYVKSRPLLRAAEYEKHTDDKPKVWPSTKFARDASGFIYRIGDDGSIELVVEQQKGDPVLANGEPLFEHRKGEVVYDPITGQPIELREIGINREVRISLFGAKYLFATVPDIVEYRDSLPGRIIDWINNDIIPYRGQLIEETGLYFEPRTTSKDAMVSLDAGREVVMNTALKFTVTVTLRKADHEDVELQNNLKLAIRAAIVEAISDSTISMSHIYKVVMSVVGDSVLDVIISNPIPGSSTATLPDTSSSWAIDTEIRPLSNGLYDVVDAIQFKFAKGAK